MQIAFREQAIIVCSHDRIMQLRQQYDDERFFIRRILDPDNRRRGWTIHHILPLKLGGGSEISNLVLLPNDVHARLHNIIDDQTHGMRVGHRGYIALPVVLECTL